VQPPIQHHGERIVEANPCVFHRRLLVLTFERLVGVTKLPGGAPRPAANGARTCGVLVSSSKTDLDRRLASRIGWRMSTTIRAAIAMIARIVRINEIGGVPSPLHDKRRKKPSIRSETKLTIGPEISP